MAGRKVLSRAAVAGLSAGLMLAGCAGGPQGAEPAGEEAGWVSLFDGETLSGWTPKIRGFELGENYRDTFRAEDGVLRVSYADYDDFGERFGHLFHETSFQSYRLRFDYRFVDAPLADTPGWAHANSGVMIFSQAPETMAVEDAFPVSVEAQLLGPASEGPRTNGNMCSPGTNVVMDDELVTQHCINSKTPAPPNGEWVSAEIEVTPAGEVIQRMNGQETIRYSDVQLDPEGRMANSKALVVAADGAVELSGGYISLQSEGHPIEFRNIRILELE